MISLDPNSSSSLSNKYIITNDKRNTPNLQTRLILRNSSDHERSISSRSNPTKHTHATNNKPLNDKKKKVSIPLQKKSATFQIPTSKFKDLAIDHFESSSKVPLTDALDSDFVSEYCNTELSTSSSTLNSHFSGTADLITASPSTLNTANRRQSDRKRNSKHISPSTINNSAKRKRGKESTLVNSPIVRVNDTKRPSVKLKLLVTPPKSTPGINRRSSVSDEEDSTTLESYRQMDSDISGRFFGGKLDSKQANCAPYTPTKSDSKMYIKAKKIAERQFSERVRSESVSESADELVNEEGEEVEIKSKIKKVVMGKYVIDTWYSAPYPEEYNSQSTLYLCEFCLKYMKSQYVLGRHKKHCLYQFPPGDEIYRDKNISIFEVDGRKNKIYCQNVCLLAKMFLDHKTLYYDVEPFLFYVLTEKDADGIHFVGYFSKEKRSLAGYNLSCIVTLPNHQRKGYGKLLIDFSYLLSKTENKTGSPEKPLSDLGLLSYQSYWKSCILRELRRLYDMNCERITINELSSNTGMTQSDIISTLSSLNLLKLNENEEWTFDLNGELLSTQQKDQTKGSSCVNPELLRWTPFLLGRMEEDDYVEEDAEDDGEGEFERVEQVSLEDKKQEEEKPVDRDKAASPRRSKRLLKK